jgi:hypothetical protein
LATAGFRVKGLTIALDDKTAAWVQTYAAQRNVSRSHLIGELLRERMLESSGYDEAMRRFLGKAPVRLKTRSQSYAARDAAHDRGRRR